MRPPWPVRLLVHAITYAAALTMLLPLAWMITTSLKTDQQAIAADITLLPPGSPGTWQWSNYVTAWNDARLGDFYLNSIIVAVVTTALSVLHNALAGFAFAKLRFAGRRVTFALTIATMLLPMQVYFIFAYLICGWLGYVDHLHALIVPFLASAFGIFYMRQSIAAVPDSLLDAGRIDGFTEFELFLSIVLPGIRPAIGALAIFTFMWSWNNFFWPLIVIDSEEHVTLPLAVARLSAGYYVSSWPVQMAAATIITVPTIIVFLLFQRSFVRGLALTGGKG
jgi:ABC-type glycerol-3-phosphate transport system permease component